MLIIDDSVIRRFMFRYDKIFGIKGLNTNTDKKDLKDGKEAGYDRTLRLFNVCCSRAEKSLAIVAYISSSELVEKTIIDNGWFKKQEITAL